MTRFSGLITRYKVSDTEREVIERMNQRMLRRFAKAVDADRAVCPHGCNKLIHTINLHHHETLGCEIATAVGRGPAAS
jgi:hypothetical protein